MLNDTEWKPRVAGVPADTYTPEMDDPPPETESDTMPVETNNEQDGQLRGRFGMWEFPILNRVLRLTGPEPDAIGLGVSSMLASAGHMNTGIQSNAAHSSQPRQQQHIY